ncbi:hypothetical protein BGZ80_001738 [Entomortierella chlamydospora]|uniref:F-box domain-containing protein n=1 Tax=Entomortierella chlamydospora TaxID=101097 RepID=A0A9P6T3V8_9FUNG|nr:hypothetical protein BGZ79_005677 [Entomortierella chlamydospora]KAG0021779.1 hypothetical protein BGZ80_001738 [Entomortierella chlamydospora]
MTDTLRASNPLDYPEILFAVGEHIPLFQPNPNDTINMKFTPKTLLSCCLVSKFWRDVLLPFVWRVHDTIPMSHCPMEVLSRHKDLVRYYYFVSTWNRYGTKPLDPPLYTQLYEMTVNFVPSPQTVAKLLVSNKELRKVSVGNIRLATALVPQRVLDGAEGAESVATSEAKGLVVSPFGNIGTTLQELSLEDMEVNTNELWRLLDPVSGNLWSLSLKNLTGTLDDIPLEGLMFPKVTRLIIRIDTRLQYRLEEMIGRCPMLEHLELSGMDNDYPLDALVHILQGTLEVETKKQKEKREKEGRTLKRWVRPLLSTLHLLCHPYGSPTTVANNHKILAAIRACSGYQSTKRNKKINCEQVDEDNGEADDTANNSGIKGMGQRDESLRELSVTLCILDDAAREAIEAHRSTLEILKITIQNRENRASSVALERQGRVLRRLLRSCRRLRVFEFRDLNADADVSSLMEEMLKIKGGDINTDKHKIDDINNSGRESDSGFSEDDELAQVRKARSETWRSPALQSLLIGSGAMLTNNKDLSTLEEQRFNITTTTNDGENVDIEWIMPTQKWDPKTNDGSDALLGERWESYDLFNEDFDTKDETEGIRNGEEIERYELIRRFLNFITPPQQLKTVQLGQLRFCR